MRDDCLHARELIELSLSRTLLPGERSTMESHCAGCPSCGRYLDDLLRDDSLLGELASSDFESVREIERHAIEVVAGMAPKSAPPAGPERIRGSIPVALRLAAAAAAVLAIVLVIDALRGVRDLPAPAFAAVIARMEEASSISYRTRTWYAGKWREREIVRASGDRRRVSEENRIRIRADGTLLTLYPAEKRAVLAPALDSTGIEEDFVSRVANWHKRNEFSFVRAERLRGRKTHVYESLYFGRIRYTFWIDPRSGLPVREAITSYTGRKIGDVDPRYGLRLTDFAPAGSNRSRIAGWEPLGKDEPQSVTDRFRWNRDLDPKLFGVVPPEGYSVEKYDSPLGSFKDFRMRGPSSPVPALIDGFRLWHELAGGGFPETLEDLVDSTRVRPLLIAAYDGDGRPGDEYRAAVGAADTLSRVIQLVELRGERAEWKYVGAGVAWGDSSRVVFWVKPRIRGATDYPCVVLYGDLRYEYAAEPPKTNRR